MEVDVDVDVEVGGRGRGVMGLLLVGLKLEYHWRLSLFP